MSNTGRSTRPLVRGIMLIAILGGMALSTACHPRAPAVANATSSDASSVLRRSKARYAALRAYTDTGTIESADAGKVVSAKRFRTRFERSGQLLYEFGPMPASEEGVRTALLATRAKSARVVDIDDVNPEVGPILTLAEATGALQGVSLLGSIFAPRLLYGIDFCECTSDTAWTLQPEELSEGRRLMRVHLRKRPERSLTLWIDAETLLLRRVQVDDLEDGKSVGTTTIRFQVTRAE